MVVVVAGEGVLRAGDGSTVALRTGQTLLVPHGAGAVDVDGSGSLELIRCRPPAAG